MEAKVCELYNCLYVLSSSIILGGHEMSKKRYGMVIGVNPKDLEEYIRLHSNVWEAVLERIANSNITNYSIFHRQLDSGEHVLFSYYEYVGNNYDQDMAEIASDPATQDWWDLCGPMQVPLKTRQEGEWWAKMTQVFQFDGGT